MSSSITTLERVYLVIYVLVVENRDNKDVLASCFNNKHTFTEKITRGTH